METILEKVKLALRITTDDFDSELNDLIDAAESDLGIAGVVWDTTDSLIIRAICTYCKLHFGDAVGSEYDHLKKSYDEQKAQMQMATGYTEWE